jgi:hypothetical protein
MENVKLQQDLQRFANQFVETVTQALRELERSPTREVSDAALYRNLLYASAAIDIATGPYPEVNLLDMLAFIRLSRSVVDGYWVPQVYGAEEGRALAETFEAAERDLWEVAAQVLDETRRADVTSLIDDWRAAWPNQIRVEGIRLTDFSVVAGEAARDRAERARGLLASVKSASQSADNALLLAERAMFLTHRLPTLLRLQARLAAREIISDAIDRLLLGEDAPTRVIGRSITARFKRGARQSLRLFAPRRARSRAREAAHERPSPDGGDRGSSWSPGVDGAGNADSAFHHT